MIGFKLIAFVSVLIPIIMMLIPLVIVLFWINRNYKTRELEHQERMLAIEKGVALPEPVQPSQKSKSNYPYTWPFIFIGFGLALILIYFIIDADVEAFGFGLISLFVGLGLFLSRYYGAKKEAMYLKEEKILNYTDNDNIIDDKEI